VVCNFMAIYKKYKKLNKFVSVCAVFLLYFLIAFTKDTHASGAAFSFNPEGVDVSAGQTVTVDVIIDTAGIGVVGADAVIIYDPRLVAITKVDPGKIFADYPLAAFDNSAGKAQLSGIVSSVNDLYSGKGTFGSLTIQGISEGNTELDFSFVPGSTTDSNVAVTSGNGDILSSVSNLQVLVTQGSLQDVKPTIPHSSSETKESSSTSLIEAVLTKLGIKLNEPKETVDLNPYAPIPSQNPNTSTAVSSEVVNSGNYIDFGRFSVNPLTIFTLGALAILILVLVLIRWVLNKRRKTKEDGAATLQETQLKSNAANQNTLESGNMVTYTQKENQKKI